MELNVVTTFAGEDSNAKNYQQGLEGWQEETGNTVNDNSATSDETFKTTVVSDFEMDAEPDVLFFFTGAVQDNFQGECRVPTFDGMPSIVTGEVSAADAVAQGFEIYAETQDAAE